MNFFPLRNRTRRAQLSFPGDGRGCLPSQRMSSWWLPVAAARRMVFSHLPALSSFWREVLLFGLFSFTGLEDASSISFLAVRQGWGCSGCLEHQLLSASSELQEKFYNSSIFSWLLSWRFNSIEATLFASRLLLRKLSLWIWLHYIADGVGGFLVQLAFYRREYLKLKGKRLFHHPAHWYHGCVCLTWVLKGRQRIRERAG